MSRIEFTKHQKKYLNPNAMKWVQMVYNNDFLQAKAALQEGHSYCCLGLGALCYEMNTGDVLPVDALGSYEGGLLNGEFVLVKQWLGLIDEAGMPRGNNNDHLCPLSSLSSLNDEGMSFLGIAKVMLAHPEAYFIPVDRQ